MKQALVSAHAARRAAIESGEEKIVGVNVYETTEPSPLTADLDAAIMAADPEAEKTALASVEAWKAERDEAEVDRGAGRARGGRQDRHQPHGGHPRAPPGPGRPRGSGPARCARCSASSGRPPASAARSGSPRRARSSSAVRGRVTETGDELGGRLRLLVGKPGLDGHSNGAEQVAVRARDAGFEVIYQGIRLTPEQIVSAAVAEDVHCVGLSILSGSHMELVPAVLDGLRAAGLDDVPVIVGGIIPDSDARRLDGARRRRGLHAQGLRADRDHGRDRRRDPPGPWTLLRHASR